MVERQAVQAAESGLRVRPEGVDSGAQTRDQAIDVARGITIIAIVMGHVVLGLTAAGLQPFDHPDGVLRGLYLLRLPTLAYLSGLFFARGVERSGVRRFTTDRLLLFAWLYVLWSITQGSAKALAGSLTNSPEEWSDVMRLWIPEGQLWFLPWLMAVTVVAGAARPWASRTRALLTVGVVPRRGPRGGRADGADGARHGGRASRVAVGVRAADVPAPRLTFRPSRRDTGE